MKILHSHPIPTPSPLPSPNHPPSPTPPSPMVLVSLGRPALHGGHEARADPHRVRAQRQRHRQVPPVRDAAGGDHRHLPTWRPRGDRGRTVKEGPRKDGKSKEKSWVYDGFMWVYTILYSCMSDFMIFRGYQRGLTMFYNCLTMCSILFKHWKWKWTRVGMGGYPCQYCKSMMFMEKTRWLLGYQHHWRILKIGV